VSRALEHFNGLPAGGAVALCRGGSFLVESRVSLSNESCRVDRKCVIRDYAPPWPGRSRPIVTATGEGDLLRFANDGRAEHDEGYILMGLELRGSGTGRGVSFHNDVDDVMICDMRIEGFRIGVHVGGSNQPAAGSDGRNQRVTLRASTIVNNSEQGWLGGCDGCSIEHSYFENNGFAAAKLLHNIYMGPGKGQRVMKNELYRSAMVGGICSGVSLVVHGIVDDMRIENNLVREDPGVAGPGCWGIAVDTGYHKAEQFRDVVIRGNEIRNLGRVAIGVSSCVNCLIENNVVVNEHLPGVHIAVPDRPRGRDDAEMRDVVVRNNSLYVGAGSGGTGILVGGDGGGYTVVSNSIVYSGSAADWNCFAYPSADAAYRVIDHNLCHVTNGGGEWVEGAGSLAQWHQRSGRDKASTTSDPNYSRTTAPYDLSPESIESPLLDRGHPSQSAESTLDGVRRGVPDIGAYDSGQ